MREAGLAGVTNHAKRRTTSQDPRAQRAVDLVDRRFSADAPKQLWVVDFTYVPSWQQTAYTAIVTDVYSRRIVGWRCASSMPTELPLDALEMALYTRTRSGQEVAGVIHHSDAGSQGEFKGSLQHRLVGWSVEVRRRPRRASSIRGFFLVGC